MDVSFVVQMKQFVSQGLAKMAADAQSTFAGIDRAIAGTQQNLNSLGKPVALKVDTWSLKQAATQVDNLAKRIKDRFSSAGSHIGRYIGAAAVGAAILTTITTGAAQQRDIVGLSTFMGKQNAASFYQDVQKDARLTPFVTHDLMAADRMLISTGMNAKRAQTDIHNLANAIAATGGSNYALERMAQHLQMIRGMGHASYLQLKEFTTNGINIMQLLNDATGKHIKMTHGMTVSYKEIELALAHAAAKGGLFYGALEAQSQTIIGKWSTLIDDLQNTAGKIVMGQNGSITGIIDKLDSFTLRLPSIVGNAAPLFHSLASAIMSVLTGLIDMAKYVYQNWYWLKYLVGVAASFYVTFKLVTAGIAVYNGIMFIAEMRTALYAATAVEATSAAEGLEVAMAATPWGMIAIGITAVGLAITELVSKSKDAGKKITENLKPKQSLSQDGGYKNPLAGGHFETVTDSSHYGYTQVMKDVRDTVGQRVKVYDRKKMWVPATDTVANTPLMDYLTKHALPATDTTKASEIAGKTKGIVADKDTDSEESESGTSITHSGKQAINITLRNLVEHFTIENHGDLDSAGRKSEEYFIEQLRRLLQIVPAMS